MAPRDSVHAVLSESEGQYVAECLEVAVVTQGRSLDETLANLRDALRLYTDGEDPEALGLVHNPRVLVTFETVVGSSQCPG
ncbi:MAG: type II toxin-antitoxin system HicB family antitoxin [Gammaproteobacteria bacterium]|nr:type II toxin-antitoxin system HicB family antitoxin [Gammaproteobacteria bacterium]